MGNAVIFAGTTVKALKSALALNNEAHVASGSIDPSVSGFTAPLGSLYLRTNGTLYVKTAAPATSWSTALVSGGGASFSDTAFEVTDNSDATKKMKFEVSGITTATTRTYTAPDVSGTIAVGPYTAGQVLFWATSGSSNLFSNTSGTSTSAMPTSFPGLYHGGEFTASASGLASGGTVRLQKLGATGTFIVRLYSYAAGLPGTLLASSNPINAATEVPEFPGESDVPFTFVSPVSLVSGTQYFLVFDVTGITSAFSTLFWFYQSGSQARARSGDGSTWFTFTPSGLIRASVTETILGAGVGSEAALSPIRGGTGVSNNAASTITISGNFPFTATLTASTSVTFPTTGTLATLAGVESLTNKSISSSNATLAWMTIAAGTGGTSGFAQFGQQSTLVATPVASYRIFNSSDNHLSWMLPDGHVRKFSTALTGSRTWTVPDQDGTIALLERTQTFSGAQTFSNATASNFHTGISLGNGNVSTIAPASTRTAYSVQWPGTAPITVGESLMFAGGGLLQWQLPGEQSWTSGEALAAGDVVYMSRGNANGDTGRTQGQIYKVDATNDNRIDVLGVAVAAVGASAIVRIRTIGEQTGYTGLTRGQPVYASVTTPGAVQVTPPVGLGQWIVQVGIATNTNILAVNPGAASSAIYIENSSAATATIANNIVSPTAVSGLILNSASLRGAHVKYTVYRSTSTTEGAETGTIRAVYKTTAATWELDNTAVGTAGVTFSINASGQILYTSTNYGGTSYAGTMNWNLETIG